jgi:acetyltransferase-like isoleucine patch superfamily enzyme
VTIEDDAWIGSGAVILPGVRIGRGAVVGANSVVTEDVPPLTVVAGLPARPIRQLPPPPGWT